MSDNERWRLDAKCRGTLDPDIFHREGPDAFNRALAICQSCTVQTQCLELALQAEDDYRTTRYGVYGGRTPSQRARIANNRKRAKRERT